MKPISCVRFVFVVMAAFASAAIAQYYPQQRPIRMIVPFPPGA